MDLEGSRIDSSTSAPYDDVWVSQTGDDHHIPPAPQSPSQPSISAPCVENPAPPKKARLKFDTSVHGHSDHMLPNINTTYDGSSLQLAHERPRPDGNPAWGWLRRMLDQLDEYAEKHRNFRLALWALFSTFIPCIVAAFLTLIGAHVADSASVYKDVPVGPMCTSAALGGLILGLPCMVLAWLRIGLLPYTSGTSGGRWMRYVVFAAVTVACVFALPVATHGHLRSPDGFGGHDGVLIMAAALGCLCMAVPMLGLIGVVGIAVYVGCRDWRKRKAKEEYRYDSKMTAVLRA